MKIKITLFTMLTFLSTAINAQETKKKQGNISIDKKQYSIQKKQFSGYEFGDVSNKKLYEKQQLPDGTVLIFEHDKTREAFNYRVQYVDINQLINVVKSVFTKYEIDEFKLHNDGLFVTAVVDMDGNIIETLITIPENSMLVSIEPERFVELENKLKKQVKFKLKDSLKDLFKLDFVKKDIIFRFAKYF
ncbi:MAG: hypothetical protein LBS69_04765 [Prevotellaceae bacterium]|jgi:hypothetical protein|nr:hypothetical protein [Prevotellaceae bacterium]